MEENIRPSNMSESEISSKWRFGTDEPSGTSKSATAVRCINDIFPWLTELYENVRLKIKVDYSEKAVLTLIKIYLKLIRNELQNQNVIRFPNRCYLLSRNIVKILYLFKCLNKQFTDGQEFSFQLCELLSIYTTLELRYSTKFEESKITVANRISLNYDSHFNASERCVLKTFISIKSFYEQKEVMRKLFEKYLKPKTKSSKILQKELDDKTYVMYLIAYKHWKTLEDDIDEKSKIEDIANTFMRPMLTLKRNTLYAPFIPAYSTKDTTKTILSKNVNIPSLTKAVVMDELRNDRGCSNETIDLCFEQSHYNVDDGSSPQYIDFPNVKFERPEVVATVDLTTSCEDRLNTDLVWLDALVEKVRSSNLMKNPANVIDIIEIDDDPMDNDKFQMPNDDSHSKIDSTKNANAYRTGNGISSITRVPENCTHKESNFNEKINNSMHNKYVNIEDFNASDTIDISITIPSTETHIQSKTDQNAQATNIGLCKNSAESVDDMNNLAVGIVNTTDGKINENLNEIRNESITEANDSSYSEIVVGSLNSTSFPSGNNSGTNSTLNEHINDLNVAELNIITNEVMKSEPSPTQSNCENISLSTNVEQSVESKMKLELKKNRLLTVTSIIENKKEINALDAQGQNKILDHERCNAPNLENKAISSYNEEEDIRVNTHSIQSIKTYSNRQKKTHLMQSTSRKIEINAHDNQDVECTSEPSEEMQPTSSINGIIRVDGDSEKCQKNTEGSTETTRERKHDNVCKENPNNNNSLPSPNKQSDEEDDEIIKNIAKKLNEFSKKTLTKKKKVQLTGKHKCKTPPLFENLVHDIPTFSSSSEENDDSGDSNILSILDESDNAEEENLYPAASRNINDDEPVHKIFPKTDVRNGKKLQSDNIIFSVTASNRLTLPIEKIENKFCNSKSNVVFSTTNHIRKNMDHNWVDPATECEENFINVSQNEITSPPMEKFTKSDKTLFQTFLNKGNELKPPGKSNMKNIDKEHIFLSQAISSENAAADPHNQGRRTGVSPPFMDVNNTSSLSSNLSNVQKRKIVSFWDTECDKTQKSNNPYKDSDDKTQSSFQQANRPGEQVWAAAINTYGLKSQPETVSTIPSPNQPNSSAINIKPNAACNFDPGTNKHNLFLKHQTGTQLPISDQTTNQSGKKSSQCDTIHTSSDCDKIDLTVFSSKCHVRTDLIDPHLIPQSLDNFSFNSNTINVENTSSIVDDIDKNLSPILPNDDLREVLSDERFLLYYEEDNAGLNQGPRQVSNCETNVSSLSEIAQNSYYANDLGLSVQHWLDENLDKRVEAHISLPLKKRRKLSQFSDNISLKEEDLNYIDSLKLGVQDENKDLLTECNSYPSTPMLSIANFEDRICLSHQPRRQFKTPAQLKEIAPVNLQTFNILPTQHTIVNNNNNNCSEVARTVQTFNILQPQQTLVNNNHGNSSSVQTYSIIPTQGNVVSATNRTLFNDGHIYNVTSNVPSSGEVNTVNVGFDLSSRGDLPNVQTFNLSPNTIQYTHSFHPNQQYTYSIQSNQTQNNINTINVPSFDIQNMINLSNYQMNPQHLSNFLHNSQINLQAKQAVLLNDIPCNLQINHKTPQVLRTNQSNEHIQSSVSICSQGCDNNSNCMKQNQTNYSACKNLLQCASNTVPLASNVSSRNKQKKCKNRSTDRITRSSNRTAIVNYKDDGSIDGKGKKKRNASVNRK